MSEAIEQKKGNVAETVPLLSHATAAASPPLTVVKEMKEVFLRLGFSQTVAMKLVDDKGIDFPLTLASQSDENIATICNMIHSPCRLVSRKMTERGSKIFVLATKNLKLMAFMF